MPRAHTLSIRVRYAESDQMGFAHHGAYVTWLEAARIEWLRAAGASYRELEAGGTLMPVIECSIRYRRPLRFDDLAELETTIAESGPSRITFTTTVRLGAEVCAEGRVTVAAVTRAGRPTRLPAGIVDADARG
jgi:acyl-CoA thioester hydrolase